MNEPEEQSEKPESIHNRLNLLSVLREIRRCGITNSAHLEQYMRLSDRRVNVLVNALRDAKLAAVGEQPRVGGRQALTLAGSAGCVVGIDLTYDQATVAVSDLEYRVLNDPSATRTAVPILDCDKTLAQLARMAVTELEACGSQKLVGVGLGLPGPIARDRGVPESDVLLPGWKGVPIAERLAVALETEGMPDPHVVVGNDASLGALGVLTRAIWGHPEQAPDDLLYVRVTHGVGMGLIIKGHLVTGADGFAGEIGHVRVLAEGPVCVRCGRRGCLEVMASEKAVVDALRVHASHEGRRGPADVAEVARAKDARTKEEVGKAGWYLGFVLAAVSNVLNPAWIVLGGTLIGIPEFRERLEHALRDYALPQAHDRLKIAAWHSLFAETHPMDRDRDIGIGLTPESLGALAFVIDELADRFLEPKAATIKLKG